MNLAIIFVVASIPFAISTSPCALGVAALGSIGMSLPATGPAAVVYKLDQGVCNDSCAHPGDVDDCAYCCPGPATCCVCCKRVPAQDWQMCVAFCHDIHGSNCTVPPG